MPSVIETASVATDLLESGLLPAHPYRLAVNHDAPSRNEVHPFGLTLTTEVPKREFVPFTLTSTTGSDR